MKPIGFPPVGHLRSPVWFNPLLRSRWAQDDLEGEAVAPEPPRRAERGAEQGRPAFFQTC